MVQQLTGAYGADNDIVDYILGITYEIWEEGGVDLIAQYYAEDCVVYGLDGIVNGAAEVIAGTEATLRSFPDRNLLAEAVIWSGDSDHGHYTSHRLSSRATNLGATAYGGATGQQVRMTNIADCVIEHGVIVKEWLVRDNMALVEQLGVNVNEAAQLMASNRDHSLREWLAAERSRVMGTEAYANNNGQISPREKPQAFAHRAISSCWFGDKAVFDSVHAPYSVMHRSPFQHFSGRDSIFEYYRDLSSGLGEIAYSIDHVASQPNGKNGVDIAVRWTVTGTHDGQILGIGATGRPVVILGVTHWHCIADRIAIENTVFDGLAVLSQLLGD